MFIVRTSVRAFLLALSPLILVQGVLFAMALLSSQTQPPMIVLPPPDVALGLFAMRIGLDVSGIAVGHFAARAVGYGSRAVYACIGGVAAAISYAVALRYGLMLVQPYEGAIVTAGILPTLAGMAAGFLYGQFAGREPIVSGTAPASLAPPATEVTAPSHAGPGFPRAAAIPTAFAGPVQVRTSLAATMLASFVPALLVTLLFFMLSYSLLSGLAEGPGEPMRFIWSRQVMAIAAQAQMFLMTAIVTVLPAAGFVALAHAIARAMRRTGRLDYAGAGALVGFGFGVALIPFAGWPSFPFTGVSFLILPLALCGAIMMTVYRRFAGLEPRSLPEPVLARELEALVPDDHPARRTHAVVLNG